MVLIKELLPNPAGKDASGEWLTLLNDGEEAVSLRGWSIGDASGKKFVFGNQVILANQELKLPYSLTRINLNNDGDTIILRDAAGQPVDELSYSQVAEEEIVSSAKIAPPTTTNQAVEASPLTAQVFSGETITAKALNPLLIGVGLALAFGIVAAVLTRKLLEG